MRLLALVLVVSMFLASGCATQPYSYQRTLSFPIKERAVTQSSDGLTISASVPGEDEAAAIFGVPLYKRSIQPVWIEIQNNTGSKLRFPPTSIDREYFAPMEVAYMFKRGFSKKARAEMEKRFYNSAMPRQIPAGATRRGYVFTHARPGTKSFNVDLYGNNVDFSFAFFVTVPGFVPDHNEVNFQSLYSEDELEFHDTDGFREALENRSWSTTSESGEPGLPTNLVIVGKGLDVLKALLRAGWHEQPSNRDVVDRSTAHFMFGRLPDATFRIGRNSKRERNELYVWQSPMRVNGEPVWMARVSHFIGQKTQLEQVLFGATIDPDLDEGRNYFLQNIWYSQSLKKIGWLHSGERSSVDDLQRDFNGAEYFMDGHLAVTWLSGDPISLIETTNVDWDSPPHRKGR